MLGTALALLGFVEAGEIFGFAMLIVACARMQRPNSPVMTFRRPLTSRAADGLMKATGFMLLWFKASCFGDIRFRGLAPAKGNGLDPTCPRLAYIVTRQPQCVFLFRSALLGRDWLKGS